MSLVQGIASAALLLFGTLLLLVAAIGILRMPDLFMRMQAATKGAALSTSLIFLSALIYFLNTPVIARVLAAIVFIYLTLPIAAHLLSRSAYLTGIQIWQGTKTGLPDPYEEEPEMITTDRVAEEDAPTGGPGEPPI